MRNCCLQSSLKNKNFSKEGKITEQITLKQTIPQLQHATKQLSNTYMSYTRLHCQSSSTIQHTETNEQKLREMNTSKTNGHGCGPQIQFWIWGLIPP